MDGASGRPVAWRSSIPGVSQRDGAPASLGLAGRGVRAAAPGAQGAAGPEAVEEQPGAASGSGPGSSFGRTGDARTRRRSLRRLMPGRAVALAVVALAAIGGVAWAAGESGATAGAQGPEWVASVSPAPPDVGLDAPVVRTPDPSLRPSATAVDLADPTPDWWAVLAELDRRRVRAFAEVDAALLPGYADPESPAWRQDSALIADLAASGLRPQGLASALVAVEEAEVDGDHAQVRIVDRRGAYSLVDAGGVVVQQVDRAGLTRWVVTLERVGPSPGPDPGWRVAEVVPIPSSGSAP